MKGGFNMENPDCAVQINKRTFGDSNIVVWVTDEFKEKMEELSLTDKEAEAIRQKPIEIYKKHFGILPDYELPPNFHFTLDRGSGYFLKWIKVKSACLSFQDYIGGYGENVFIPLEVNTEEQVNFLQEAFEAYFKMVREKTDLDKGIEYVLEDGTLVKSEIST